MPLNINSALLNSLPAASKGVVECFLLQWADDRAKEAKLWTFFYNPQSLSFTGDAKYSEAPAYAAREPEWQYNYATGLTLEIADLYMDTFCLGKSLLPVVDGLDALRKADLKSAKFAPPILSFLFGQRRFAPCVLTRISWKESAWLSGEPARLVLNMTLQKVPEPGKLGLANVAAELAEIPRDDDLKLTERQQQEGSDRAKAWLNENVNSLQPQFAELVRSNGYSLSTDTATGITTILDGSGKEVGKVGKWDGKEFTTENVTTLLPQPNGQMAQQTAPAIDFRTTR